MRADLGDVSLEWELCGEGPDLVWLHGLSGSLEESRPIAERLGRDHRVLWFSTRGHGRSSPVTTRERYGYDHIADDLARMLDHVGLDRPLLAGGSHGANTILRHEVRHPGRARAALLVAPGANALRRPKRPQWWLVQASIRRAQRRGTLLEALCGDDPAARAGFATHDVDSLLAAMRWIADQQVVTPAQLGHMDLPVTVAAWDKDPVIHPIAVGRAVAAGIPGARFVEIGKAADMEPVEAGDLLARLVAELA